VVCALAACLVLRFSRHGRKKHDGGSADAVGVQQSSSPWHRSAVTAKSDNSTVPAAALAASIDTPMVLSLCRSMTDLVFASCWLTWFQKQCPHCSCACM
jgi:hypothetical protein